MKAYLVVIIDTHSLRVVSAGVFSEPTPTMAFHFYALLAHTVEAPTFAEAKTEMLAWIEGNMWIHWVKQLPSKDWLNPDSSHR